MSYVFPFIHSKDNQFYNQVNFTFYRKNKKSLEDDMIDLCLYSGSVSWGIENQRKKKMNIHEYNLT